MDYLEHGITRELVGTLHGADFVDFDVLVVVAIARSQNKLTMDTHGRQVVVVWVGAPFSPSAHVWKWKCGNAN